MTPPEAVLAMAELVSSRAWEASQLIGASLDPENEDWDAQSLVEAALALKDASVKLAKIAAEADRVAADALGDGRAVVDEVEYKSVSFDKRDWEDGNPERLRDAARKAIATEVGVSPLTGDIDDERARIALETIDKVERFVSFNPKQFKTDGMKRARLDFDDYCQAKTSRKLVKVPAKAVTS